MKNYEPSDVAIARWTKEQILRVLGSNPTDAELAGAILALRDVAERTGAINDIRRIMRVYDRRMNK